MFELGLGGQHVTTPATGTDGEPSAPAHGSPSAAAPSTELRPGPVPAGLSRKPSKEPAPSRPRAGVFHRFRVRVFGSAHMSTGSVSSQKPWEAVSAYLITGLFTVCLSWGVCSPAPAAPLGGGSVSGRRLANTGQQKSSAVKTRTPQPGSEMMSSAFTM